MKRIHPLFLSAFFALLFAFGAVYVAAGTGPSGAETTEAKATEKRAVFEVSGVTCGSCESKIRKALEGLPGVTSVEVNISERKVAVEYREEVTSEKTLGEAIGKAGFPTKLLESSTPVKTGAKPAPVKKSGCGGGCCG
jgi:copper chaperone CopZ